MTAMDVGSCTDTGRVRDHNEDSILVGAQVFAVADGMGGHAAGEVASATVLQHIRGLDHAASTVADIHAAVTDANAAVLEHEREHPETMGMGSTLAGLAWFAEDNGEHLAVFHVGDSRVYWYAAGQLTQVTHDHSHVQDLVDEGLITAQEAATHPARNVVTRSLGSDPAPEADVVVLPLTSGERWLVCSDGLTGEVDDQQIAAELATDASPQTVAQRLVELANEHGGRDNISVIVIDVVGDSGGQVHRTVPRAELEVGLSAGQGVDQQ